MGFLGATGYFILNGKNGQLFPVFVRQNVKGVGDGDRNGNCTWSKFHRSYPRMKAADVGVPTIRAVVVPVVGLGAGAVLSAAEEEHPRGSGSDTLKTIIE